MVLGTLQTDACFKNTKWVGEVLDAVPL